MNEAFFNNHFRKRLLKKWISSQVSLLVDDNGVSYVEKIEKQVNNNGQISIIPYGSDELEIYQNILSKLNVEHVNVVASERKQNESKFALEFVNGLTCSEAPKAIHLYKAALKIREIYKISQNNMKSIDVNTFQKYHLTKEKIIKHIKEISKTFDASYLIDFIDITYDKYSNYPIILNHYDMHFKNMIYSNDNIYIIDWATTQLSPFYSDLYTLLEQAEEVGADSNIIIDNYKKSSGLKEITEEEILMGAICWCIPAIHWLLDLQGTDTVPFYEWAQDEFVSLSVAFNRIIEICNPAK